MNTMLLDLRVELAKAKRDVDIVIQRYRLDRAGFPYMGISQSALIARVALEQAIIACEGWSDIQHHIETACATVSEEMNNEMDK